MSQAEVKLRKFRETLTDNADGNPEPSPVNREGAETRHGVCLVCGVLIKGRQKTAKYCSKECRRKSRRGPKQYFKCIRCNSTIPEGKNANAKFCSEVCRSGANSYNSAVRKGRIKSPGVGSGYGEGCGYYVNGISLYQKTAFENLPHRCNRCGKESTLLVHHINHDRTNNDISNLEILCKKCHQQHHCTRDVKTGRFTTSQ